MTCGCHSACAHTELQRNLEDNSVVWIKRLRELYERFEAGTPQYRLGLWRQCWGSETAAQLFEPIRESAAQHSLFVEPAQIWYVHCACCRCIVALTRRVFAREGTAS